MTEYIETQLYHLMRCPIKDGSCIIPLVVAQCATPISSKNQCSRYAGEHVDGENGQHESISMAWSLCRGMSRAMEDEA